MNLTGGNGCGGAPKIDQLLVTLAGKVVAAQEPVLDVVQRPAVCCIRRPLPLQLEHNHATARESQGIISATHTQSHTVLQAQATFQWKHALSRS